jgi:hypothetical protein
MIYVNVQAFLQNGRSDYFLDNGKIKYLPTVDDPADVLLGSGNIRIWCYQSKIVVRFRTSNGAEPDWSKGQLQIFGVHDNVTTLKLGQPGVDGFSAIGKDTGWYYTVFYQPKLEQIRKSGKTKVLFTIPDPTTQNQIHQEIQIDTP